MGAIALVTGFTAINQLFQYPAFTIILGTFIGIMAIGMGGLFSIRLPSVVYKVNPKQDSGFGSFLFGVMTAVLSTPCTAPFMGAAAAWATTQSAVLTLTVFGSIGFGMAVPYLVLATFPHLVEKMPRAGAASEVIKQVMGLLMLAAAVYFIGVGLSGIMQQEGAPLSRMYLWIVSGCIAAAGLWLAWRIWRIVHCPLRIRLLSLVYGFGFSVSAYLVTNFIGLLFGIEWGYKFKEGLSQWNVLWSSILSLVAIIALVKIWEDSKNRLLGKTFFWNYLDCSWFANRSKCSWSGESINKKMVQ